ncbi:unnamed protein product [Auanema sp. JU1783]|nr:unnamed protein product [Auanema sp. JU1783]
MITPIVYFSLLVSLTVGQSCSGTKYNQMNGLCPGGMTRFGSYCCPNDCYSASQCTDLGKNGQPGQSDCPNRTAYCSNSAYRVLMQQQCPSTCGWCLCEDKVNPQTGRSDCASMKSYCTNSLYASFMKTECPVTCGYCR